MSDRISERTRWAITKGTASRARPRSNKWFERLTLEDLRFSGNNQQPTNVSLLRGP